MSSLCLFQPAATIYSQIRGCPYNSADLSGARQRVHHPAPFIPFVSKRGSTRLYLAQAPIRTRPLYKVKSDGPSTSIIDIEKHR